MEPKEEYSSFSRIRYDVRGGPVYICSSLSHSHSLSLNPKQEDDRSSTFSSIPSDPAEPGSLPEVAGGDGDNRSFAIVM